MKKYIKNTLVLLAFSSFAVSAQAYTFSQTLTAVEKNTDGNSIVDPFTFAFSGLPTLTGSSFTLDLKFTDIDLDGVVSNEFLATIVNSNGSWDIGPFDTFAFTDTSAWNADGTSTKTVSFSQVGGLPLDDPFQVILTPGNGVNAYSGTGNSDWGDYSGNDAGGRINLTFSAEAVPVPEPSTYAMFGTAFAILGFVGYRSRSRKS